MTAGTIACRCLLVLWLAMLANLPAHGADTAHVGAYDFGYLLSGDARAKPVQVFDDGRHTYFQFRAGEAVPAIFAARSGGTQLLVPQQEGPYVRVPDVHGRFVLQVGRAQADVVHAGGGRPDVPPVTVVATNGMKVPYLGNGSLAPGERLVASLGPVPMTLGSEQALDRNSHATPLKGDRVYWPERSEDVEHAIGFARGAYVLTRDAQKALAALAAGAAPLARFTVIGRDDDSYKEGLDHARAQALKDALGKAGIAAERITVRTGVARPGAKSGLWESTVRVQTPDHAPAMRASPAPDTRRTVDVADNVEALVRSGVLDRTQAQALLARRPLAPQAAAAASSPPTPEVPSGGFTLSAADKTISGAVRRWAQALDYRVVWDAPLQLDAAIAGDARLPGQSLSQALDHLVRGLLEKGYALEVTIYANRVIRFTAPSSPPARPSTTPSAPRSTVNADASTAVTATREWRMRVADRTIATTLARWAADAQWRVVWSAADQVPVTGDAVVKQPDFRSAAEFLMQQVAASGYRLRVTTGADRTLQVSSY